MVPEQRLLTGNNFAHNVDEKLVFKPFCHFTQLNFILPTVQPVRLLGDLQKTKIV